MKTSLKKNRSMASLIKKQATGTQTVTEFCRKHRIKPGKFYYWNRKLNDLEQKHTRDFSSTDCSTGAFVPVAFPAIQAEEITDKIELHFPSGLRVWIPTSAGSATVKTILQTCGNK